MALVVVVGGEAGGLGGVRWVEAAGYFRRALPRGEMSLGISLD